MATRVPELISYAEYLAIEQRTDQKHEFLDGAVFAMAGGTPTHARLAFAVGAELRAGLAGKRCAVFSSDLKIRVLETGLATYPDVAIVCGEILRHPEDKNAVTNPTLLVEVLSESTESNDRGRKFAHYRRIPSLREYVLVSQDEQRIEVHRKNASGHFELHEAVAGESLVLETTGAPLSVDAVYADPLAR